MAKCGLADRWLPMSAACCSRLRNLLSQCYRPKHRVIGVCRNVSWCTVLGQTKSQPNDTDLQYQDSRTSSFLCIPLSYDTCMFHTTAERLLSWPIFQQVAHKRCTTHAWPCLSYSSSASHCFFRPSALASLNLPHAADFCFCCKRVKSSFRPTLQPASLPTAMKNFLL